MVERSVSALLGDDEDEEPTGPIRIGDAPDIQDVYRGVTVTWLMQAFRMDRSTVKKRLADCTPLKYERGNTPIYDFVQACEYLVTPKVEISKYLRSIDPSDLPNDLQKDYWDALLKRQRWEEKAGNLWKTEDVIEVFGEAFKHIKESTQLWSDELERKTAITDEQRKLLEKQKDKLLDDIHKRLCRMQTVKKTRNSAGDEDV